MKRGMGFFLVFVFLIGVNFVHAGDILSDDWNRFAEDDEGYLDQQGIQSGVVVDTANEVEDSGDSPEDDSVVSDDVLTDAHFSDGNYESGIAATKFTTEFWIAMIIGAVILLVVAYLVYSFLRSPSNRWRNKK